MTTERIRQLVTAAKFTVVGDIDESRAPLYICFVERMTVTTHDVLAKRFPPKMFRGYGIDTVGSTDRIYLMLLDGAE